MRFEPTTLGEECMVTKLAPITDQLITPSRSVCYWEIFVVLSQILVSPLVVHSVV